jgi:hypothetical protein
MPLRLNVQQQNSLTFEDLLSTAQRFRETGLAAGLVEFFCAQEIDIDSSAIVWAQSESYMLGFPHGLRGLLVTSTKNFFEFELELNAERTKVMHVHDFLDVTSKQNMSIHNRGTGQGYGALCLQVLEALNQKH